MLDQLPAARPKILVLGDVMLDVYRIANATRISPEAPVPVLLNSRDEFRLGGAGAVAAMCAALGAEVSLVGTIGEDSNGRRVLSLIDTAGVVFAGQISPARCTTVKERICAVASGRHRQQLCRIDTEDTSPPSPGAARDLAEFILSLKNDPPDVIVISDYNKGFCVDRVVQACRGIGVPVIVDPPKNCDWTRYYGVTCIVPNREEAAGKPARDICRQLQTEAAVVKLDSDGCELFARGNSAMLLASRAREVHDVTGAGDQFIAMLAVSRATGASWRTAAIAANLAAGLQVARHGCVPVTREDLLKEMTTDEQLYTIHDDRTREAVAAAAE